MKEDLFGRLFISRNGRAKLYVDGAFHSAPSIKGLSEKVRMIPIRIVRIEDNFIEAFAREQTKEQSEKQLIVIERPRKGS